MSLLAFSRNIPKIFFLDLEVDKVSGTTGGPRECITQICVLDPEGLTEEESVFEAHVKPKSCLSYLDQRRIYVHGHREPPKYKIGQVLPDLVDWVAKKIPDRKAVFLAHGAYKHDLPILNREFARENSGIPKSWNFFCTHYLTTTLGINPKTGGDSEGNLTVTGLCHLLGVKVLEAHDAYNDAIMLKNIFYKLVEGVDQKGIKKIYKAMVLPPSSKPVVSVANIIKSYKNPSLSTISLKSSFTSSKSLSNRAVTTSHQSPFMVFFDFEGTGLFKKDQPTPRATELGWHIPATNHTYSQLIDPEINVPEEVVKITGITDEMIQQAGKEYKDKTGKQMDFKAVWLDFEKCIEEQMESSSNKVVTLAGYNIYPPRKGQDPWQWGVGYDLTLLKSEIQRMNLSNRPMKERWYKAVDVLVLLRKLYREKGISTPRGFLKLQNYITNLGIQSTQAHRAGDDAYVTSQLFDRMIAGLDPNKVDAAILSSHPINNLCQLILDEGDFKPENYPPSIEPKESKKRKRSEDHDLPSIKRRKIQKKEETFVFPTNR